MEGLWATSGAEQRGGVIIASGLPCERTPPGSGNQRRTGMKQNCLLFRGCFAILDEDVSGQENEESFCAQYLSQFHSIYLYFLIRHRDLKLQRLR